MVRTQVQVKRKETERQQEMRLRSYAYLAETVQKEAWKEMCLHSGSSTAAHNLRSKLLQPQDRCLAMDLAPQAYLAALVPGRTPVEFGEAACLPYSSPRIAALP